MHVTSRWEEMHAKALKFHEQHPEVWNLFRAFAFDRIEHGHEHYSADAVMHRVRWETDGGAPGPYSQGLKRLKISNNHIAFYARWFLIRHPEHGDFFRTCVQKSRGQPPTGGAEETDD